MIARVSVGLLLSLSPGVAPPELGDSQSIPNRLPQNITFQTDAPAQFEFTCDYIERDENDELRSRRRIVGRYVRGLPDKKVRWENVHMTPSIDPKVEVPAGAPVEYMEGFTYSDGTPAMFLPTFFQSFPPGATSTFAKNLVWDTHMFELFGRSFWGDLRLNAPFKPPQAANSIVPLAGVGTFQNRDITLTWVGLSSRHGESCALIEYEAFHNRFDMAFGPMKFRGMSHYWGTIWVSLEDQEIEYATLREDVTVRVQRGDNDERVSKVLRIGTFEKLADP